MAIKTIEILNVMVFKRHLRKNNAAFKSIEEGDSFNDGFKMEFCDGINVLKPSWIQFFLTRRFNYMPKRIR